MKAYQNKRGKNIFFFIAFFTISIFSATGQNKYALVIHGGAGHVSEENLTDSMQQQYHATLALALKAGEDILKNNGTSLDAVEAAIKIMEDSPLFNAGKGAVFNLEGKNELDASVMCGMTLNAGAVAGITNIKNPVSAARKVMENSPHVLLTGKGAETFAYEQGLEIVDPGYFFDTKRWNQYRRFLKNRIENPDRSYLDNNDHWQDYKLGTVGAVALDQEGNIAAATSTGGMTGKQYGRIGDSPIIGAGNFADNASCGVSATGHGEFFIRNVVAHDIAARVKYNYQTLEESAEEVINKILVDQKANGGIIAIDKEGNIVMKFNTPTMFRGFINVDGEKGTAIFR
ncbi:MAG: isoaspartyl peptidase/L-asparaginase family protein [Bacteroidales bacterium]